MDTMVAFAMGEASRGKELMVFDWDKAATMILKQGASDASAGLASDWEFTGGTILEGGAISDDYTFLASTWATPQLEINGIFYPCYRMQSEVPEWGSDTRWPDSAKEILKL